MGIVLIPFQSKVIYLYALPIILFTRDLLVKPVEPGQGADCHYKLIGVAVGPAGRLLPDQSFGSKGNYHVAMYKNIANIRDVPIIGLAIISVADMLLFYSIGIATVCLES